MYAVIKTGGKQYRVKAGDVLVVEKLGGEPGSSVAFDEVLMLGDDGAVVVGAPTVAGASVSATLIETRKGEKIKVFKKIRRQGYRRTGGHRQQETVLRVTSMAVLNARARGLKIGIDAPVKATKLSKADVAMEVEAAAEVQGDAPPAVAEAPAKAAKPKAAPKAKAEASTEAAATETAPKAAKKPAAAKTKAKTDGDDA